MATKPDYYAILGVSSMSDDVVIRAAFKALMLKYHPDTNRSPDATQRAAAINEAFSVLGDPTKRVAYDASLGRRASGPSAPPPTPPDPPTPPQSDDRDRLPRPQFRLPTWGKSLAGLIVVLLVGLGVRIAIHEANRARLAEQYAWREGPDPMMDGTMVDNMTAAEDPFANDAMMMNLSGLPSALGSNSLSGSLPLTPTNVVFRDIEAAAESFETVLNRRGIMGARAWSENCHKQVEKNPSWAEADKCAAFDYAARFIDKGMTQTTGLNPNGYFVFQAENQANNYKAVGGQPYLVTERLRAIKTAVEPLTYEAVMAGIQRRESKSVEPNDEELILDLSNEAE